MGVERPDLVRQGRDNLVGAATAVAKLNGQVYTPPDLAARIVARLPMRSGARWLDPACGDGVFLQAAVEAGARAGVDLHVEGWDLDEAALGAARSGRGRGATLRHQDALAPMDARFDVIVGNPPYLEAKRMPDGLKARVRDVCPVAATGAFDLYGAFVERALQLLAPHGVLAFVLPNRLLVTAATEALRLHLLDQGRVSVIDLSGSGVFGAEAAVYPIVLLVHRGESPALEILGEEGVRAAVPVAVARRLVAWPLAEPGVAGDLLTRVLVQVPAVLGDHFDVRWAVSFHRSGLRDRYVTEDRPDSPHARRFLGGGRFSGNREVIPYGIAWAGWWIDHDEARAREDHNGLPPASLFERPKVLIPQNARRARAALDLDGHVVKDTFLVLVHPDDDVDALKWVVLVLHSDVVHVLYEQLYGGTRKGGGFLHFLGRYLAALPFPRCPDTARASALHDALARGEARQAEVEGLVREAFGVTPAEASWLGSLRLPSP